MKDKRLILYMALAFIGMMLWTKWSNEHAANATVAGASSVQMAQEHSSALPPVSALSGANGQAATSSAAMPNASTSSLTPESRIVTVKTDALVIGIDLKGGNIIRASLPNYPKNRSNPNEPMQVLSDEASELYVADSGLMGKRGPDTQNGQVTYQASQPHYQLQDGQNELNVDLTWQKDGIQVTKSFLFTRSKNSFSVNYTVHNASESAWQGNLYSQIRHYQAPDKKSMFGMNTYQGAAISSSDHPYQKITYKEMDQKNLSQQIKGGWVALQQRYFLSAWVPNQGETNHYYSHKSDGIYTIGYVAPELSVAPNQTKTTSAVFYVGPELQKDLEALAPHLGLTIDYGWLWWASGVIFWLMQQIYHVVGNWGWAIVLVTLFIKLAFYKLSEKGFRSMAKMKAMQPKLNQLKQRYADDKNKLNKATMELYQKEKINPLGGCLPMVVQIPIFLALYYVLIESVQLRHAPFMFWIQDLSAKDPYYILPILMGISMYAQQLMNPPQMDKTQEMMMKYGLPIVFTVLFASFPSGLVLYWFVNNVLSILQQEFVMRRFNLKESKGKSASTKTIAKKKINPSNDSAI